MYCFNAELAAHMATVPVTKHAKVHCPIIIHINGTPATAITLVLI